MKKALETAIKLYMNKIELPLASIECEELGINVDLMTKPTEEEIKHFYGKAVELLGRELNKDENEELLRLGEDEIFEKYFKRHNIRCVEDIYYGDSTWEWARNLLCEIFELRGRFNKNPSQYVPKNENIIDWLLKQKYTDVDENSFINKVVNHINSEEDTSEDIADLRLKGMKGKNLSRLEVEIILLNYPGVKIAHTSFSKDEYIYSKEDANVYTEENYLFEDWCSYGAGQHNGMRMRTGGIWEKDWYIKE